MMCSVLRVIFEYGKFVNPLANKAPIGSESGHHGGFQRYPFQATHEFY